MKIIIDARCVEKKMHGIARYTINLILNLTELDPKSTYYVLHTDSISPSLFGTSKNIKTVSVNIRPYSLAEQLFLPRIIKKIGPDIYHSPTFAAPVMQPCPTVITIHDMIHLTGARTLLSPFYRLYYFMFVKSAAMRAKRVITVSSFSKREISRVLGIELKKIEVTYNGIDNTFFERENTGKNFSGPASGYWLFVGNEKPHKNVVKVIKAYSIAKKKDNSIPPLVLIGVSEKFLSGLNPPERVDGIILLEIGSDKDLVNAYRRASLFIAPSKEEGFGFPVVEAMATGTPVITAAIPVLKEITAGSAVLVDPRNEEAISEAMLRVHGDDALKGKMSSSGVERAGYFNLKKTAEQTLKIYREISKG